MIFFLSVICIVFVSSFTFFSFCFFRAMLAAYGSSQARGWIGAAASSLRYSHSNARSELHPWPMPQLMTTPDPQPTEARDPTHILSNSSQVHYHWATIGTSLSFLVWFIWVLFIFFSWWALLNSYQVCLSFKKISRSSCCSLAVRNPTSNLEDVDSIPGLAQWVTYPALPWAVV